MTKVKVNSLMDEAYAGTLTIAYATVIVAMDKTIIIITKNGIMEVGTVAE